MPYHTIMNTAPTDQQAVFLPPQPLTPEVLSEIIEEYTGKEAAEVIRAINGIPEAVEAPESFPPATSGWGEVAMWLALGAAAVAWILTHR
jgi:hypothetical protein